MNNQIETFIDFLLDTETTSDILFSQTILEKDELYHKRYQINFEKIINKKLQQWKDYYEKEQSAIAARITLNAENKCFDNQSDNDSEEQSSSDNDDDEDEEEEGKKLQSISKKKDQASQSIKLPDIYIDPIGQCKRLLQFLYHCQQNHVHFIELYFRTLDYCIKNDNEKIGAIGLQQIALHLSDNDKDRQRLIKYIPSSSSTNIIIPELHKPILSTIDILLSTQQDKIKILSLNDLDILYPQTARFLDLRREFRDSTHYFIDGDSLILSIAHHINIDLISYFGNTLHVIFIIERILLTLFNQTHQCNYTLIFFDCHYQIYREDKTIFNLIRSCLITHILHNTNQLKIQQFSSWLDNKYIKFTLEEKPHFIFYHDISSIYIHQNKLLSEDTLKNLVYIYRLFGNYHQYHIHCHLYLMNKLILTDTTVKCFQIRFNTPCPMKLFKEIINLYPKNQIINEDQEIELEEINHDDIRILIYLKTLMKFNDKPLFELISPLLILHISLLIRLSLIDRHLPTNFSSIEFSPIFSNFIIEFQQCLALNLSSYSSNLSWSKIVDIFDGRLFAFTIYQLSSKIYFDLNTMDIVNKCLTLLKISNNENIFSNNVKQLIQSKDIIISSSSTSTIDLVLVNKQKIARISNPFIDTFLKPILSTNEKFTFNFIDPEDSHLSRYEGKYHWHVYKEVGDEISRIRDNDQQHQNPTKYRYRTKTQQQFYTYFTLYGKSLTSRDVRDNQLQIVLPSVSTNEEEITRSNSASGDRKKQKNKNQSKQIPQKSADKIREEVKQQKLKKRIEEEPAQIAHIEELLKAIPTDDYIKAIDLIDKNLIKFETSISRIQLLKRKFHFQRKYLQLLKSKTILTSEEKSKLNLLQISYFATMTEMVDLENIVDVFNQKKKYLEELVHHSPLDLEIWYRFQLEKVNSRLPRREQGIPDSRIHDFIPDKWQVDFLDAVDKQQSIIIVAPTASGKTYASYYAMNKVLKDPNDPHGICVYIAPTKALVNQVAATIYSKFGPVFGIFTRDYRTNMNACRILVTVPQCMEILLLSPNHQRWCQRIKYAIFDEIHCMSGEQGSDVWEKIILLINCPMIGLSATVNNGEYLCQWIEYIENQRSKLFKLSKPRRVCFIIHHERLADLNKYLYTNQQLYLVHPIGIMNGKQLITRGLPKDFSLSPCETLQLHDAMKTVSNKISLPTLTESFSSNWIIERSIFNNYSQLVRNQFQELINTKNSSDINSIAQSLQPINSTNIQYPERKSTSQLIINFILTLKEQNLLPCIVFSDDRKLCEDMASYIAEYYEKLENNLRQTKYKNQIGEITNRSELFEKNRKKTKPKKEKKSSNTKRNHDENNIEELNMFKEEENTQLLLSGFEQQLLNGILDDGTLANQHDCDRGLVDALLERAGKDNPRLVKYMKRGVAYHHSGLNNKGRVAVEALFRNRYIQVVFSTSTLALGIHMPTKTVAFVKDSIYLDALQYRQSSGRAGRRGFDIQGHVVFVDIPLTKIRHLILSAIPNIHAHFPTSVTFLMRLLHLYSNTKDSNDAMNRSLIALECPFLGQSPTKKLLVDIQTRFHGLFTLDFLYRLNLINKKGDLIGLAGLLTHLHYFEPANILLVYLMDTRLFHIIKDPIEIMIILAYLFTNMPWLITQHKYERLSENRKKLKYNSKLFLPPIENEFRQRVDVYNAIVKEVYGCYIENVTKYLRTINNEQIEILPFSNISFAQQNFDYDNGSFEYHLHHHHSQQIQNPSISPFAGLSGLTHQYFMSNYNPIIGSWDLVYDIDLSSQIVPFIDIDCRDHMNIAYQLNSYVLDFYKHGSEKLLIMENKLNSGDTYSLLLDFRLILSSITTSLQVIQENEQKLGQTEDLNIFSQLFQSLSNVENKFLRNFQRQYPNRNRL